MPATSQIQELCREVAGGNRASIKTITKRLCDATPRQFSLWPESERTAWSNGLETILLGFSRLQSPADERELAGELLAVGYDSPAFRDVLLAAARKTFAAYPDPAGLMKALGILDGGLAVSRIAQRWDVMAALSPDLTCFHANFGTGTIREVDGCANDISGVFGGKTQHFPPEQALDGLVLIRPGTLLDKLVRKQAKLAAAKSPIELRREAQAAIIPQARFSDELVKQILVPAAVTDAEYRAFLLGAPIAAMAGAAGTKATAAERAWHEARSLEELADILVRTSKLEWTDLQTAAIRELLLKFAAKKDQANFFALSVGRLWKLSPEHAALTGILGEVSPAASPWQDTAHFVQITDDLPGKSTGDWFAVTLAAKGIQWLCEAAMSLPNRLLTPLLRMLEATPEGTDIFEETVLQRIARKNISADVLLWLWKSKMPEKDRMVDPNLIFNALKIPVRGSFLKANKELRKLLLEDEEFQRFLMHDGEAESVSALVSSVRTAQLLDSGEQQSLLVRIVRIFPEAISLVEQRQKVGTMRAHGLVTSQRSFELRRRELDEIVNVKIPANSHAIAHARSYGDLRENAEFKSAKEEQRFLRTRRADLERGLNNIKSFDFTTVTPTDQVIPGSLVDLKLADGRKETYTVLGMWDAIPEKNYLSYESPLGKLLVGKKIKDAVTLPNGSEAIVTDIRTLPAEMHRWLSGEDLL